jgi:alpha-mannosidase
MKKILVLLIMVVMATTANGQKRKQPKVKAAADTIQVIGHAHMDMNWLWTTTETMQMCNDNLRQVVAFMKEFPDYTMLQSQAAIYNFVEKADFPLFEEVKKYVKEGRLELAGGMWTEGDMNMSSGEAISRTFLLGQRYFKSRFGKMANIGWLPDNFGHITQMPQILKLAGCDYFYFHRCKPYLGTFWWIAPDSSRVLCYANDTYNGEITPDLKKDVDRFSPVKRRILQITGVGDHGGGPTRVNIEMVHQLDKTPDYASVKFTSAGDFFRKSSNEMDGRPTHRGEMQFIFEGC